MKMMYNGTPIKSLNVKHFEMDTNDCTAIPSDLQAGITCVSKGKKITGTGKSFEFAQYGTTTTNTPEFIPAVINIVEITSLDYPVKSTIALSNMKNINFDIDQIIGTVVINNVEYPITMSINENTLMFNCEKLISLDFFYGRDRYA